MSHITYIDGPILLIQPNKGSLTVPYLSISNIQFLLIPHFIEGRTETNANTAVITTGDPDVYIAINNQSGYPLFEYTLLLAKQ